ncbi:MAG: hypothetical protein CLLPBCKN_004344 [Chroococcidiopsis cubana SAG 39.79]|uniref:hypothetical protein n=1 Tax=Chroococcidiopsis cubana TaxID=171392 RepID=UPI00131544CC|nr:hypothetical protein [Chroococcidiopsis cubana]MDZ4874948.1 hypothetical protein [Chroococcidiopsis cubana SAG 39.79]
MIQPVQHHWSFNRSYLSRLEDCWTAYPKAIARLLSRAGALALVKGLGDRPTKITRP